MTIKDIPPDRSHLLLPLLHQVHDLHLTHQPRRYRPLPDEAALVAHLRGWLDQPGICTLGYFNGSDLLGYAIFELEERSETPFHPAGLRAILHQVCVDKTHRRRGIGLALLEETRARLQAAGGETLVAMVASFNVSSAALMARAGLQPVNSQMEWCAAPPL